MNDGNIIATKHFLFKAMTKRHNYYEEYLPK